MYCPGELALGAGGPGCARTAQRHGKGEESESVAARHMRLVSEARVLGAERRDCPDVQGGHGVSPSFTYRQRGTSAAHLRDCSLDNAHAEPTVSYFCGRMTKGPTVALNNGQSLLHWLVVAQSEFGEGMSFWRNSKRQAAATTIALKHTLPGSQLSVRASDAARSMNPSEPTVEAAGLYGQIVPFLGSSTACDHGLRPVCVRCRLVVCDCTRLTD